MDAEKSWGHFYKDAGSLDYYNRHVEIHQFFLDKVLDSKPKRLLEAGCGSGIMSVFFSKKGIDCVAIDKDEEVLRRAEETSGMLDGRVLFSMQDIFKTSFREGEFDAVFSQGVLEHFSDEEIRRIVAEQLRVASKVWISVPSKYYRHRDYGNERLLTQGEWQGILKGQGRVQTEYYYYTRVKRNFMMRKPLMLMVKISKNENSS